MIQQQTLVMALVDMITHIHKNIISRYTRGRASGNSRIKVTIEAAKRNGKTLCGWESQ
jgi:hypothetical protein